MGLDAEGAAADHLVAQGWVILDRNWRGAGAELDIVAEKAGELAFVEVKSRRRGHLEGLESIGGRKRRRLIRAAEAWLARYKGAFSACSFVVASLVPQADGWEMVWLFDAFDA